MFVCFNNKKNNRKKSQSVNKRWRKKKTSENPNDHQTMNAQIVRHVHWLLSKRSRTLTFSVCCVANNLGLWVSGLYSQSVFCGLLPENRPAACHPYSLQRERWGLSRYCFKPGRGEWELNSRICGDWWKGFSIHWCLDAFPLFLFHCECLFFWTLNHMSWCLVWRLC